MSARKGLLLFAELVAVANAVAAVLLLAALRQGRSPDTLEPYVFTVFLMIFPIWGCAVFLVTEFTGLRRTGQSWWQKSQGLSFGELAHLLRWCSPIVGTIAAITSVASLAAGFGMGTVSWHSGEPFTPHHVIGFSLGALAFCSLALPVFSSARRMPGSFSDHYGNTAGET